MKFQVPSTAALLGLSSTVVLALTGGFLKSCNTTTIQYIEVMTILPSGYPTYTPTLSGLCESPAGIYTNSTLDLNSCIENSNGVLVWLQDGSYGNSCGCELELPQLCCGCQLANGGTVSSGICIDLDDGISEVGGQLACNLPDTISMGS